MNSIDVQIVRIVDSSFPEAVEFLLRDANGREWPFIDKSPVFMEYPVIEGQTLPLTAAIPCELVREWTDEQGRTRCLIDTAPWGVEANDGETRFEVFKAQLR